mgnify:CR=1 FL=1
MLLGKLVVVKMMDRPPGPPKEVVGVVVECPPKIRGIGHVYGVLIAGKIEQVLEENVVRVLDD